MEICSTEKSALALLNTLIVFDEVNFTATVHFSTITDSG